MRVNNTGLTTRWGDTLYSPGSAIPEEVLNLMFPFVSKPVLCEICPYAVISKDSKLTNKININEQI